MKEAENINEIQGEVFKVSEEILNDVMVPGKAGDSIYGAARISSDVSGPMTLLKDVLFDVTKLDAKKQADKANLTEEEKSELEEYDEFDSLMMESYVLIDDFQKKASRQGKKQTVFKATYEELLKPEKNATLENYLDRALSAIEKQMSKLDNNSYRYKLCKYVVRHFELMKRPDFLDIVYQYPNYNTLHSGVVHLPTAEFVDGKADGYVYDFDKYEALSGKFPQIDMMLAEQDFFINNVIPHNDIVESGINNEKHEKEYKEAYVNHLLSQTKINNKLSDKTQDEVVGTGNRKYKDYQNGWVFAAGGSRYTVLYGNIINEEIAFLNSGWTVSELNMLKELKGAKNTIITIVENKSDEYFVRNKDSILEAIDNILEGKVESEDDRIKLLRDIKPYVDKYNQYIEANPSSYGEKMISLEAELGKYTDMALSSELETINDVEKLYDYPGSPNGMNKSRAARIKKLLHVGEAGEELIGRFAYISEHTNTEDLKAIGFTATADNRNAGVFLAYLMGVKGLSYDEATKLRVGQPEFDEMLNDFNKFIKDNSLDVPEGEKRNASVKALVDMFKNAAEKFKSYRFHDINFGDADVMDEHIPEYIELSINMINITQEYELMVKHAGLDTASKFFDGKTQEDIMSPFYALNGFGYEFLNSYAPQRLSHEIKAVPKSRNKYYGIYAQSRAHMGLVTSDVIRGKTISEIEKSVGVLGLYETTVLAILSANPATEGALDYLTGKSKDFEKDFAKRYKSAVEEARLEFNSEAGIVSFAESLADKVNTFGSGAEAHIASSGYAKIMGNSNDSDSLHKAMEYDDETRKFVKLVNDAFYKLYNGDNAGKIYNLIGIKDPLELIKINGKTPNEKWGEDYKNYPEADKSFLLKARVVDEMFRGRTDITVDTYIINEKNELEAIAPYKISKSVRTIDNEISFYKGINDLNDYLKGLKNRLVATQDNQDANFAAADDRNAAKSGSDTYKKMTAALNKCIRATDFDNNNFRDYNLSYEELEVALKELKTAANQYYKAHDTGLGWLVSGYRENGKERIRVSKDLTEELGYRIETLKDLSYGVGIRSNKNLKNTTGSNKLKERWSDLKKKAVTRKVNISNNDLKDGGYAENTPIYVNSKEKDFLRRELMEVAGTKTIDESFVDIMDSLLETNPYTVARKFIKSKYLNKIRRAETGAGTYEISFLADLITSKDFKDTFADEVKSLAENDIFANMVKKNPKTAISEWKKSLRNEDDSRFKYLERTNNVYKNLVKNDPKHARDIWNVALDKLEKWKKIWNSEDQRMADVKSSISSEDSPLRYDLGELYIKTDSASAKKRADYTSFRNRMIDTVADILAYSLAKDNQDKPDFMSMVINPDELDKTREYIKKGLEKDVFAKSKDVASIMDRLNSYKNLKMRAQKYVKDALDAEKEAKQNVKKDEPVAGAKKEADNTKEKGMKK